MSQNKKKRWTEEEDALLRSIMLSPPMHFEKKNDASIAASISFMQVAYLFNHCQRKHFKGNRYIYKMTHTKLGAHICLFFYIHQRSY